jgi:hypothetical protein
MTTNVNAVGNALTGSTGTGTFVGATSPTLVTPTLGVASATSINFGGTALSAYATGTFTPVLTFGGASVGITYSTQSGTYVKIGNAVIYTVAIVLTNKGTSTGNANIIGLPVTCVAYSSANLYTDNITYTGQFAALIPPSGTNIQLTQLVSGLSNSNLTNTNFSNTSDMVVTGVYLI